MRRDPLRAVVRASQHLTGEGASASGDVQLPRGEPLPEEGRVHLSDGGLHGPGPASVEGLLLSEHVDADTWLAPADAAGGDAEALQQEVGPCRATEVQVGGWNLNANLDPA